jgi:hypothetical protein
MAGLSDLNSFVGKFLNLWQSGRDASLNLTTCDGRATINLQLGLGQAPPPPSSQPPPRHVPGPSRQRRTQRRALARQQAEQAQAKTDKEEAAENANEKVENDESESGEIATDVVEHINNATDEVTVVDEAMSEQAAAAGDIIIRDKTIEELNEKLRNLSSENLELKNSIMVTQMFYDGFRDERREKFGYDSDEEAEKNWQEVLKRDELEKSKFTCDKCEFGSKSEAGLNIHKSKKHRENL